MVLVIFGILGSLCAEQCCRGCRAILPLAARGNTWLLIKLTPNSVVLSSLVFLPFLCNPGLLFGIQAKA